MEIRAFAEKTPSIFVISSPLQVICAIEAIKKYKIEAYKIILFLVDDIRNSQVFELCDQCNLNYDIVKVEDIRLGKISLPLKKRHSKYKRVFIGDPRSICQLYIAFENCSDGSVFVNMDDGDDNIFLLSGYSFTQDDTLHAKLFSYFYNTIVPFFRRIRLGVDFFTIYADIPTLKYKCQSNSFDFFSSTLKTGRKQEGVYFIGTNHNRFCEKENYSIDKVKATLETFFRLLKNKYPSEVIYYIPHGRDTASFPISLCDKYGIEYIKPSKTVELMFIDQGIAPKVVYGFTSTALYTLKLLFPSSSIFNVVLNVNHSNVFIKQIETVSDYYRQHGIEEVRI